MTYLTHIGNSHVPVGALSVLRGVGGSETSPAIAGDVGKSAGQQSRWVSATTGAGRVFGTPQPSASDSVTASADGHADCLRVPLRAPSRCVRARPVRLPRSCVPRCEAGRPQ